MTVSFGYRFYPGFFQVLYNTCNRNPPILKYCKLRKYMLVGKIQENKCAKIYMVTLRNHSAVIYFSHKNLKHRFFKSNFPIYSMVLYPCMDWNTWTTCTETVVSLPTEMHLCRPSHCVSPCIFANYSQNNWRTKVDSRTCSLLVMMLASHFGLNLLKSLSNVACSGIFRMSSQSLSA